MNAVEQAIRDLQAFWLGMSKVETISPVSSINGKSFVSISFNDPASARLVAAALRDLYPR